MPEPYYSLFLRNWMNHIANETHIDQAVALGYLTEEEATTIKNTPR